MRIVVDLTGYYHWKDVPPDVEVTKEDILAQLVRPTANDVYQAKTIRNEATNLEIMLDEKDVWATVVEVYNYKGLGRIIGRKEAIARHLSDVVLEQHAHPSHVEAFQVHDDHELVEHMKAHADAFRAHLEHLSKFENARHKKPIVNPADIDKIVAAYSEPATADHHVEHLHNHFGCKKPEPKKEDAS